MKKILLTSIFGFAFLSQGLSQVCTPNGNACSIPTGGTVCTNPSPHLDTHQNSPVDTVLFFVFAKSITQPLSATLNKVKVTGVTSIPAGLTVQLPIDSTFLPSASFPSVGPIGCVRVTGTPTQVNQISDSVKIEVSVNLQTPFGAMDVPQTASYRIAVLLPTALDRLLAAGKFELYPNPTNNSSRVSYTLNQASRVSLTVIDIQGRLVDTVFEGIQAGGYQEFSIPAGNLPAGLYNVILRVEDQITTQKLVVE